MIIPANQQQQGHAWHRPSSFSDSSLFVKKRCWDCFHPNPEVPKRRIEKLFKKDAAAMLAGASSPAAHAYEDEQ